MREVTLGQLKTHWQLASLFSTLQCLGFEKMLMIFDRIMTIQISGKGAKNCPKSVILGRGPQWGATEGEMGKEQTLSSFFAPFLPFTVF